MDLSQLDFHDATLLGVCLDPVERTVEIRLAYYPSSQSRVRVPAVLNFRDVTRFNQISDMDVLQAHAGPGNITDFICGESQVASHLYLVGGLIEIAAASVTCSVAAETS
ncbi:hypothetical protein FHR56_003726 [Xanthomonas sacchari]|uniref:hypothetical protein n=1 Tax=Xanthomonas sp. F10 TaxID=3035309 RepID=UPI00160ED153|nr:hypothetical protein [Xanthomonas sp. F10]MBB6368547.1 hypothetical protein [Xanthomonas sp. F10]